jgi:hypothetical protein
MFEHLPAALQQLGIGFLISCMLIGWTIVMYNIWWNMRGNRQWKKFINRIEEFRNDFA